MRGIDELDHYELLEVRPSATRAEIDRAYRMAQQTFSEGSLALYSIFGNADAASIRERIDEAYQVLVDADTRDRYDRERLGDGASAAGTEGTEPTRGLGPPPASVPDEPGLGDSRTFEAYDPMEDGDGEFGGIRLRRARLFRGYELDDVSSVTKVSGSHLRNIEEENYVDLPADVYVRGFVTAYAKTIGLDPEAVVPSYMARMQQARREDSRARLLARR